MTYKPSPFLYPGTHAQADSLAIIHLRRDLQEPCILRAHDDQDEGYAEGKVINTRFGSFPHKTLIDLPWGSQVRASKVDTGSRGRRGQPQEKKKRKREDDDGDDVEILNGEKEAEVASSGFVHLLPPTPENWTSSLPHRTQVVYTPDYSYVLHRLRARPGSRLIEAGAGSGSFTHASARAVYNGYPVGDGAKKRKIGKVWSYEFHEQRHGKLVKEIEDHGLKGIVDVTHRDVCSDGFLVGDNKDQSPMAEAIFLDLPAPWLALPHLSRRKPTGSNSEDFTNPLASGFDPIDAKQFISPLSPTSTISLCTFSPCMEQVQKTISAMRRLGWTDIDMVEISQKRLDIRRERVGIPKTGEHERGLLPTAASVDEALNRLQEIEGRFKKFHTGELSTSSPGHEIEPTSTNDEEPSTTQPTPETPNPLPKNKHSAIPQNPNSRAALLTALIDRKIYKEGRLVHRTEPEIKTHTSYLVFAVLQREWADEDEAKAREKYPIKLAEVGDIKLSGKDKKRADRQAKQEKAAAEKARRKAAEVENVVVNGELGGDVAADVDWDVEMKDLDRTSGEVAVAEIE